MGDASSWSRAWSITGDLDVMRAAVELVQDQVHACGWDDAASFAVRLAFEEALTNALRHGHGGDATLEIAIEVSIDAGEVRLGVTDQGPGFDPGTVPDPRADENLTIASGRGLALIRAFMTTCEVVPPGNSLQLRLTSPMGSDPSEAC